MAVIFDVLAVMACGFYVYVFFQLRREEKYPGWRQRKLKDEIIILRQTLHDERAGHVPDAIATRVSPQRGEQMGIGAAVKPLVDTGLHVIERQSGDLGRGISAIRRKSHG
jgi:hypothetical protein